MTSDRFHTGPRTAGPGPPPRREIKAAAAAQRLSYANLQDKYILILLEYKLTPQLSEHALR